MRATWARLHSGRASRSDWFRKLPRPPVRLSDVGFRLQAPLKHYDWGVPGALSKTLGLESSGKPEAEVWWGNHPLAECSISTPDGLLDFGQWLGENGVPFPLLVKLLAAQKPLSIQVHPTENQAQEGFRREEERGIPLEARERTFKDSSAKPELIVALSDNFLGLAGFASERVVRDRITRWFRSGAPEQLARLMESVAGDPFEACRLITSEIPEAGGAISALERWLSSVDTSALDEETRAELRLVQKVSSALPGDSGVLFAGFLQHVNLTRGEALFVEAGDVHAYVEGMGLEIMWPSDNVIRAGLTTKHKDTEAFLQLSNFSAMSRPRLVTPHEENNITTYEVPTAGFAVERVAHGVERVTAASPSVCFVESGQVLMGDVAEDCLESGEVVFAMPGDVFEPLTTETVVWIVHTHDR